MTFPPGIPGHALLLDDKVLPGHLWRRWCCSCGVYMGATRAEAREAMRLHRLDLRVGPA